MRGGGGGEGERRGERREKEKERSKVKAPCGLQRSARVSSSSEPTAAQLMWFSVPTHKTRGTGVTKPTAMNPPRIPVAATISFQPVPLWRIPVNPKESQMIPEDPWGSLWILEDGFGVHRWGWRENRWTAVTKDRFGGEKRRGGLDGWGGFDPELIRTSHTQSHSGFRFEDP